MRVQLMRNVVIPTKIQLLIIIYSIRFLVDSKKQN